MNRFHRNLLALALAATAGAVQAAPILRISDGVTTYTVADGSAGVCGDVSPAPGFVGLNCSIGNWMANMVSGVGHDVVPNESHLNSVNLSNGTGGTITVMLTDTDYLAGPDMPTLNLFGQISSSMAAGSVNYAMYVSDANTPFGLDTLIGSGTANGGFLTSFGNSATLNGPYSMTLVATVTHKGLGTTAIDFVGKVPEPATLALLGLGLAGIGFAARRRAQR